MPRMRFTDKWVKSAKAQEPDQTDYFDPRMPGFGLRVSRAGRKTWFCMKRHGLANPWGWAIERQEQVLNSFAIHRRVTGSVNAYSDIAETLVKAGHSLCHAGRAQQIVQSCLNGDDQRALLSPRTYYRYRRMLLGYGIYIGSVRTCAACQS